MKCYICKTKVEYLLPDPEIFYCENCFHIQKARRSLEINTVSIMDSTNPQAMISEGDVEISRVTFMDIIKSDHISFFSTNSFRYLCSSIGLFINDMSVTESSIIYKLSRSNESKKVVEKLLKEMNLGLYDIERYRMFKKLNIITF